MKVFSRILSLLSLTLLFFSCQKDIPVEGLSMSFTSLTLEVGESKTLVATVFPENATVKDITWFSSDEAVVSVNQYGVIEALKAGLACVTASTADGIKATCDVTVKKKPFTVKILADQTLPSVNLAGDKGKYNIMLPEGYENSGRKYPVLYLLHGMYDNNTSWSQKGDIKNITEIAVRSGKLDEFIVVMPNAYDSFYVNGTDARTGVERNYESFFWEELIPHIEATYPVMTDRQHTAIAGLSMGGFGCTYYGFKHPDRFCLIYSMSGAVGGMGSDAVPSIQRMFEMYGYNESNYDQLPFYIMDCGDSDTTCGTANLWMEMFLNYVNFPHVYRQRKGGHEWPYWIDCYTLLMDDLSPYFKPSEE